MRYSVFKQLIIRMVESFSIDDEKKIDLYDQILKAINGEEALDDVLC